MVKEKFKQNRNCNVILDGKSRIVFKIYAELNSFKSRIVHKILYLAHKYVIFYDAEKRINQKYVWPARSCIWLL